MSKRTEDQKLMIATLIVDSLLERQQNKQDHKRFQIFAIITLVSYLVMDVIVLETHHMDICQWVFSQLF